MWHWKVATFWVGLEGLFCLVGGWIGLLRAGSVISALVGTLTALMLGSCLPKLSRKKWGSICLALVLSCLLDIRFSRGYLLHHKVMPHLLMGMVTSLTIAFLGLALLIDRRIKRKLSQSCDD